MNVVPKLITFDDLDVGSKTYDEAAGAFKAVDCGFKEPFAVLPLQVFLCQGEFLQEEALCPSVELQDYLLVEVAHHTEDIGLDGLMLGLKSPVGVHHLNGVDALYLEHAIVVVLDVIGPDINHIGCELDGLHQAVFGLVAVGGFVLLKDHLLLALDGIGQGLHVGCVCCIVDIVGNRSTVIDTGQLPLQVTLEDIVVVDALDHLGGNVGFFFGEINQPVEIGQPPGHLSHGVYVTVQFVYDEAGFPYIVDVPVDCTRRNAHFLCHLVDSSTHVAGEYLHQAKHLDYFGLVHNFQKDN